MFPNTHPNFLHHLPMEQNITPSMDFGPFRETPPLPIQQIDINDDNLTAPTRITQWLSSNSVISPAAWEKIQEEESKARGTFCKRFSVSNTPENVKPKRFPNPRFADRNVDDLPHFHEIGFGFCGHIFDSKHCRDVVFKRAKPGYYDDLRKDAEFHEKTYEAMRRFKPDLLRMPRFHSFIEADDAWWSREGHQDLATQSSRPPILCSEKIKFLPKDIRDSLIEVFSNPACHDVHKANILNRDCLLRIYLGKRLPPNTPIREFKLRNFEMTLEKLELLDMCKEPLARSIAQGLALMHWGSECDARDVEFVFGFGTMMTPTLEELEEMIHNLDLKIESRKFSLMWRTIKVWLLDFNQCRKIEMNREGVEKCVQAFWDNDPYYPRPGTGNDADENLWDCFKDAYLAASNAILDSKFGFKRQLPASFIDGVVARGKVLYHSGIKISGPPRGPPKGPPKCPPRSKEGTKGNQKRVLLEANASHLV